MGASALPRVGFLGVGWIGRHRMEAMAASGLIQVAAVADTNPELARQALERAPRAHCLENLDQLLELDLDGLVVATPSALHAEQSVRALERGLAVFCQKPLGRSGEETAKVVQAARRADRLLGVDLSYRGTAAMAAVRQAVSGGELGRIFAVNLVFHNAYGPDKPWFYDRRLAGGGCVMDLGIHLLDLALWTLDFPRVHEVLGQCFSKGRPLAAGEAAVEDYANARLTLADGTLLQLGCSWHLPAGCDAVIEASFFGTQGGISFRNVNGSFYDFEACRFHGTRCERLVAPPDDWGGRAAVAWAAALAEGQRYDPGVESVVDVARVIDRIYGLSPAASSKLQATG